MKKCVLPKNPSDSSKLTFNGKFMTEVLKRVDSVTRFSESADTLTHSHLLVCYKGDVFIVGRTPDTFVCHEVNGATSETDTVFNIDPKHLLGLINKREMLDVEYRYPMVSMKEQKGRYKSEFKVQQLSPEQIPMVEEGLRHHIQGGHTMSREVIEKMNDGIKLTRIKDHITDETIICRVMCDGRTMKVISPGDWTATQYISDLKKEVEAFRFSMTGQMFDLVNKFCGDEKVTFHVDSSAFTAEAESFVMTLPPVQSTDEDYRFIDNMFSDLGKPITEMKVKGDFLAPFLNIGSIMDSKGNVFAQIKAAKQRLTIKFGNDKGSVQDALKLGKEVKKEIEALLDIRIMKELLKNVTKEESHQMGFFGSSINDLTSFTLSYKNEERSLLYFGYLPQ